MQDNHNQTIPTSYQVNFANLNIGSSSFPGITPVVSGNKYTYKNPGTWPSGSLTVSNSYAGGISFNVTPTCATVTGQTINFKYYIRDFYYAYAGSATPSGLAYVLGGSAGQDRAVTYTATSDLTLTDQTGTVQGVSSTHSWNFRVASTGTATAPFVWIGIPTKTGINVVQTSDISTSTVLTPISYSGGTWYQVSTSGLVSGTSKDYKIDFTYTTCTLDSLKVLTGWNCSSYPTSPLTSCGYDSMYLKIQPQPSQVQLNITRQPGNGSSINLCSTDSVLLVINSALAAKLTQPYITVYPPAGLTFLTPVKVEYPLGSGNYQNATVTSLAGGGLKIDLTAHTGIGTGGLLGTASANPAYVPLGGDRQAKIKLEFTTDCSFTSGNSLSFTGYGQQPCGSAAVGNGIVTTTNAVNITGATASGSAGATFNFGAASINCSTSTTLSLTVTPTTLGTITGDTVVYTLPAGMGYAGNFVPGTNCASCTATPVTGADGITTVKIKLQPGVAASSTLSFSFDVNARGGGCGASTVTSSYKRDIPGLTCGATTCSNSSIFIATGTSPAITLIKPNLSISAFSYASGSLTPGSPTPLTVSMTVDNSATVAAGAGAYNVEFFCGTNTTPFATTPFPSAIPAGGSATANLTVSVPAVPTCNGGDIVTAKIQPVTATNSTQCMCSTTSMQMLRTLPVTLSSFTAVENNCKVVLNWKSGVEVNLLKYQPEYSTDAVNYKAIGSINPFGDNSTYSITHQAEQGRGYYRIRMIDNNGSIKYSAIISLNISCTGKSILLFPNPARDQLNVNLTGYRGSIAGRMYNAKGQLVLTKTLINGTNIIDTRKLPVSVYSLVVTDNNGENSTYKVQVNH